jgi:hypothetical protein
MDFHHVIRSLPAALRRGGVTRVLVLFLLSASCMPAGMTGEPEQPVSPGEEAPATADPPAEAAATPPDAPGSAEPAGEPEGQGTSAAETVNAPVAEAVPEPLAETAGAVPVSPEAAVPPAPGRVEDMAAYLASVRQHVEDDPSLASAYLVFWSELKAGSATDPDSGNAAESARYFEELAALATTVSTEVGRHYGKDHRRALAADVVKRVVATLSSRGTGEPVVPGRSSKHADRTASGSPAAERLLANLDVLTRPGTTSEGRYRFAGTLRSVASIGASAEVWNLCRAIPACVKAHDGLFAPAMAGLSIIADSKRRLSGDVQVADSGFWKHLQPIAAGMDADTGMAPVPAARQAALKAAAAAHWNAVMQELPLMAGMKPPAEGQTVPEPGRLDALFALGLAGAEIAGADKLANAFQVARRPALDFASLAAKGAAGSALLTSMAGAALVVAGVQAIALLDGDDAIDRQASAQMRELITTLDARTYGALRDAASEQMLAINALDARIAGLGLALDVVKTDVARLESAGRRRIASNWQSETAQRWTAFDSENQRCFSLRRRDPQTQRLSRADFRWCEERFLQGATQKARYANKSSEYAMDPRFIEAADRDYPFHAHWPMLLASAGLDQKQALALPDPVEWQQYAAALLRLYRDHPAQASERAGRLEALRVLAAAGARLHGHLRNLLLEGTGGAPAFRGSLHRRALDDYLAQLARLAGRVEKLDDPATHGFGKRMTAPLDQAPPEGGARRTAIESALRRSVIGDSGLRTCAGAPPEAFMPNHDRVTAEARRFFGSPVTAGEVAAVWNRELVNHLSLEVESLTASIPAPWLWAALAKLGSIDACLSRMRPESLSFTREEGPGEDTLKGSVIVAADLEIRFLPHEDTARTLGMDPGASLLLGQQSGGRACTFGYRNDDEGCSRAQCLADIAPTIWGTDKRLVARQVSCNEEPLRIQLAREPDRPVPGLEAKTEALAPLYWSGHAERIARIEADVLRSDEFIDASGAWLRYYALAGVTLGPWPEPAEFLADLFAVESALAPREVVRTMLRRHVGREAVIKPLREQLDDVFSQVESRGRELVDTGAVQALPHLAALEDTLGRIGLLEGLYAGSAD